MPDTNAALKSIFFEALERNDPAARAAYLDGACGDDAVLCRRVEALLAAHDGAGRFLEGDPADTSLITAPETPESTRGVRPGDTSLVGNGHRRTQNRRHNLPDRGHRAGQPLTRIGRGPGHCRPVQPARNPRREVQGHPLQADDDHRPVTWLFGRSAVEPITCVVTRRTCTAESANRRAGPDPSRCTNPCRDLRCLLSTTDHDRSACPTRPSHVGIS
jgi:hypothetical protein